LTVSTRVRFKPARGPHADTSTGRPPPADASSARPVGWTSGVEALSGLHDRRSSAADGGLKAKPGPEPSQASPSLSANRARPARNRRRLHPYLSGTSCSPRHGGQQQRIRPVNLPMRRGLRPHKPERLIVDRRMTKAAVLSSPTKSIAEPGYYCGDTPLLHMNPSPSTGSQQLGVGRRIDVGR